MIRKALISVLSVAAAWVTTILPASADCDPTNPQSFISTIWILDKNYVLHPPGSGGYSKPTGSRLSDLNLPPTSPILTDLMNAFANAPLTFRARLCGTAGTPGLTAIFINASGCTGNDPTRCKHTGGGPDFNSAWGFRSFDPSDQGATYIAIAASDLWDSGNPARPLSNYESQMLKSFRGWNGAVIVPGNADGSGTNPDTSWMSVLAAMAHEVGHVRWAVTTIRNPVPGDNPYDLKLLTECSAGDFFIGWDYDDQDDLVPPNRWRPFRGRAVKSGRSIDHSAPPYLRGPFGLDNPQTANADLWSLYQSNQPWASLFAAQVPDEDFVESYVMAVLTGYDPIAKTFTGPLTSMPLNAGYVPLPDVPNDLVTGQKLTLPPAAPGLQNKISCIPL